MVYEKLLLENRSSIPHISARNTPVYCRNSADDTSIIPIQACFYLYIRAAIRLCSRRPIGPFRIRPLHRRGNRSGHPTRAWPLNVGSGGSPQGKIPVNSWFEFITTFRLIGSQHGTAGRS
jgi:hypothetical protein